MSGRGLGPLRHIIGMRLGSVGRGQTVTFFTADVTREDLMVLHSCSPPERSGPSSTGATS